MICQCHKIYSIITIITEIKQYKIEIHSRFKEIVKNELFLPHCLSLDFNPENVLEIVCKCKQLK